MTHVVHGSHAEPSSSSLGYVLAAALLALALVAVLAGCARKITTIDASSSQAVVAAGSDDPPTSQPSARGAITPVVKSDAEWKKLLTRQQFHVLREKGTERAFTGALNKHKGPAVFVCAGCGLPLFDSATKFDSGTGWPSFYAPIARPNVVSKEDRQHGMERTEVLCARCGGHLGHVFDDGPRPTGLRYCINSAALKAVAKQQ